MNRIAERVILAFLLCALPIAAAAPQQRSARPSEESLQLETLRYYRDSIGHSMAIERSATVAEANTQDRLASKLGVRVITRAEMLRCGVGCTGAVRSIVKVSRPEWANDTAKVVITWLRREWSSHDRKDVVAEGADEFLLALRGGRLRVIGLGGRVRQ